MLLVPGLKAADLICDPTAAVGMLLGLAHARPDPTTMPFDLGDTSYTSLLLLLSGAVGAGRDFVQVLSFLYACS